MRTPDFRFGLIAATACTLWSLGALGQTSALANPIGDLPGRWSGSGTVNLANGASEPLKCIATYFVTEKSTTIQQNLRCASTSYKIDAQANLKAAGAQLTGSWIEKTYSAAGSVVGRVTGNGFVLAIEGDAFTAAMSVNGSDCKQSISITPKGFDLNRIAINLSKC